MEKHSFTYTERRTYGKYDANNIIGYLNEERVPDFLPEGAEQPTLGYKYTGTEKDGGTVMPCSDPTSYPEVTNAIIRSKYSESDEMAIHRHYSNDPEEYAEEWQEYNDFCESAKALAKDWLGIE
ncbi:MAG: hypothetical protein K6G70_01920 [Bacteroidaceae bacterium]|nr:hypothetical protein [Bacteroidaceae bacterium]